MSGTPALDSPAPSGLRGVLRSWLNAWTGEVQGSPEERTSESGSPEAHAYGSVRVLVVDDNPVNLMLMSALMETRGMVPLLAADGAEAVALASELQFDLILMDLQMPILDGLGATRAIRRFETERSRPTVPVVAYSCACPGPAVLTAYGLNGSLNKPCDDQELDACLAQWCPTYRPAPALRNPAHDNGHRQSAARSAGTSSASLG